MTSNTTPYVRVKNIDVYQQALKDRANTYCIIKGDGSYVYLLNGEEIPGHEWEANNPVPTLQANRNDKGFLLDSRTNWFD